jgi:hypothetical protein
MNSSSARSNESALDGATSLYHLEQHVLTSSMIRDGALIIARSILARDISNGDRDIDWSMDQMSGFLNNLGYNLKLFICCHPGNSASRIWKILYSFCISMIVPHRNVIWISLVTLLARLENQQNLLK